MKNEILEEVWRNRDEFAKRYSYNINAMVAALQEMERHSQGLIVNRRKETPNPALQRTLASSRP